MNVRMNENRNQSGKQGPFSSLMRLKTLGIDK